MATQEQKTSPHDAADDIEVARSHQQGDVAPTKLKEEDVAVKFLAGLDQTIMDEPIAPGEARKLLWKVDLILLPLLAITAIIAAVDKVIISNAALYGMKTDTNLVGNEYSWVGSIFYFGYLVSEWPCNLLLQKLPLRYFFSGTVLVWSILTLVTGATQNFGGLASVRFLMGMSEAAIFPVASVITAMWWQVSEQPIRVAIWFNTLSSVVTGLLAYGIGHTHTSVAPWRLLFIVLGSFSLLWTVVIFVFIPSSPVQAWWLNDREKYICLERIRKNNTGMEDKTIKWYQMKECLLDPKSWLISIYACAVNIPNGGLVTFAALIVNGLGFSALETTLLGVPTGVIAWLWSLILNITASRLPGYRCILIAIALLFPMTSAICMWKLDTSLQMSRLAAYYGFYSYWAPYAMCLSLPMANTSGHTKKVTLNAMFFIGYCVGNIIGPQCFQANDAPDYHRGYIGLLACLIVSGITISAYGLLCKWENNKRDRLQGSGPIALTEEEERAEAFSDMTDKEKLNFRYTY